MKNELYQKLITAGSILITAVFLFAALFLAACSASKNLAAEDSTLEGNKSTVSFQAGVCGGGLVENVKMKGIKNADNLDAITGATKLTGCAGIHTELNLNGHRFETGLDYMGFSQSVKYDLPSFAVDGKRDFKFHQIRIPLTYNFRFLNNSQNLPGFIIKLGLSAGFTLSKSISTDGNLPDYKFTKFDFGPMLGFSVFPLQINQKYRIGLHLDLYRGSRIFEDLYHKADGIGSQTFLTFGLIFQPLNLSY